MDDLTEQKLQQLANQLSVVPGGPYDIAMNHRQYDALRLHAITPNGPLLYLYEEYDTIFGHRVVIVESLPDNVIELRSGCDKVCIINIGRMVSSDLQASTPPA